MTRDRLYAKADWAGKYFMLVDTGGIVPASEDVFEKAIREQAMIAIDEADSIIFVCDGRAGITPIDSDIAALLRSSNKHVTLAINKADSPAFDADAHEFYALGLGEPFSFSALNGRSTGDLLDHATEPVEQQEGMEEDPRLKIAIVGRPNSGKSSIVNTLLGQDRMIVTPVAGTTRDAVDSVMKYHGEEIVIIDTAGLRRRARIKENIEMYSILRTQRAIDRCDVAVVLIDSELGLEDQDKKIINDVVEARRGVIIAFNKWDIVEKDSKTADAITKQIREDIRTLDYIPIVFVSALTKQRVTKIVELCREVQERRQRRISTSELNGALLEEIEKTPPPSVSGRDLRINYITQVGTQPPVFAFFSNHPELIPDSYKRFLERKMRDVFELEGVPVSFLFKRKNVKREY